MAGNKAIEKSTPMQEPALPARPGEELPSTGDARHAFSELEAFVEEWTRSTGAPLTAEEASSLLPLSEGGVLSAATVKALLSFFGSETSIGHGLGLLRSLLSSAGWSGAKPEVTKAIDERLFDGSVEDPVDGARVLERLFSDARRSLESRLADAVRSGAPAPSDAVESDLRVQLSRTLQEHEDGARAPRASGREALHFVLERLHAMDLHNLRGMDVPYLALELPFSRGSEGSFIRKALIHFFGEGRERRDARSSATEGAARVVLDLTTSTLGELWITLTASRNRLNCEVRCSRSETKLFLEAIGEGLDRGLRKAGYDEVGVSFAPARADRLRETSRLLKSLAGINVRV